MVSWPIEASRGDQLDGLLPKLPELRISASLCSQLAGCDPLTPKVLSSLAPVRSLLELLPIEQLPSRVQSLIRRHAISARKRRLEEISTVLRGLPTARSKYVQATCEKLSAVATLKSLVDSCPTQSSLR